jgi:hypothetical protein
MLILRGNVIPVSLKIVMVVEPFAILFIVILMLLITNVF